MNVKSWGPLLALLLLAQAWPAFSAFKNGDAGTTAASFLSFGADARGTSLGQAMTALSEDANAVYWNPAGLARLDTKHAAFTHAILYQSVFYDFMAYAQPVASLLGSPRPREARADPLGSIGVAVLYLNAGRLGARDSAGVETGEDFAPQEFAVSAAWGAAVLPNVDVGIAAKYVHSEVMESDATGAVDVGARLRFRIGELPSTIAVAARHLGGKIRLIRQSDPLPATFSAGQSIRLAKRWTVSAEIVAPNGGSPYAAAGAEALLPVPMTGWDLALRGGYYGRPGAADLDGLAGLSLGCGFLRPRFSLDYGWTPYGVLEDTQRFTLSFRF